MTGTLKSALASLANLLDDARDSSTWLGTNTEPFVGLFEVESVVLTIGHWIIRAKLLDVTTVATLAAVDSNDFIIRTILGTLASESECYHNLSGGRGSCSNFADLQRIF